MAAGGRILAEDVDAVREALDLYALVAERVVLKKSGKQFTGLCPFHSEKSPSFLINPEKGVYYCHGCGHKGNAFRFLMDLDGLTFAEAVEFCARKAGITLRYDRSPSRGDGGESARSRMRAAYEEAVGFYHRVFLGEHGGPARDYWKDRGFDRDDAVAFSVGWAPPDWDALVRHLGHHGFTSELLVEAGLAVRASTGRVIDFFRERLLFPIRNQSGDTVAFGGRLLPPAEGGLGGAPKEQGAAPSDRGRPDSDAASATAPTARGGPPNARGGPKYLNSPDSPLYSKSRVLFHLHEAASEIRSRGEVVVVEGYTDVIALAKAGLPHAVASCGTALGEPHLQVLGRYGSAAEPVRVVLAFDADPAGQRAADRGFDISRGLPIEMLCAVFPAGSDPADVALADPEAARAVVAGAVPLMEWKLTTVLDGKRLDDPEARSRVLRAAAAVLAQHPDPIARDIWSQWLADRLGVAKGLVDREVRRPGGRGRGGAEAPGATEPLGSGPAPVREVELIRVAVFGPASEAEKARQWPLDTLRDPRVAAILPALAETGSVGDALEILPEAAARLLAALAVEEPEVDDLRLWAEQVFALLGFAVEGSPSKVDDMAGYAEHIERMNKRQELSRIL